MPGLMKTGSTSSSKRSKSLVKINDHAVVRFLERIRGVDIEALKKEIVPSQVKRWVKKYGDGDYTHEGITYRIRSKTLVTIWRI